MREEMQVFDDEDYSMDESSGSGWSSNEEEK